jgi:hypothetical protein
MGRIALIALSFMPLGGCGYVTAMKAGDTKPRYDASRGANTAVIIATGRQPFDPACRIVKESGVYREVVVDAGAVALRVECARVTGVFGD